MLVSNIIVVASDAVSLGSLSDKTFTLSKLAVVLLFLRFVLSDLSLLCAKGRATLLQLFLQIIILLAGVVPLSCVCLNSLLVLIQHFLQLMV